MDGFERHGQRRLSVRRTDRIECSRQLCFVFALDFEDDVGQFAPRFRGRFRLVQFAGLHRQSLYSHPLRFAARVAHPLERSARFSFLAPEVS